MDLDRLFGPAFRWTDPATWPVFLYVWLAFILAGFLSPIWKWVQRQRVNGWPTALGEVQSANFAEAERRFFSLASRKSSPIVAELGYSYRINGAVEGGIYKRDVWTEAEAAEFVRDLKGKPVSVHYNPNKPSKSALSDDSIDMLLRTRVPKDESPDSYYSSVGQVPDWLRPLLWVFVALSVIGLVLSVWVHLNAVFGRRVAHEEYFWGLHVGIFVVWIPAVLVAQERVGSLNRKDFWKVILKGAPDWVRFLIYGLFAYAVVNFLFAALHAANVGGGSNPPAIVWRGFSGHWMVFYAAALAILYPAAQANANGRRCSNGHFVSPNANFCSRCGQPTTYR